MSQSEGQVEVLVNCSRPRQTDVIFVAMNDLAEKVYVEHLIAGRKATVKSYPCVFHLTFFFSESSSSWLHPWLPHSQLAFHDKFLKGNSRIVTRMGKRQDRSVGRIQ